VFETTQKTITLTTDEDNDGNQDTVEVDMLTIGAVDVNAFAGMNASSSDRVGFEIANLNFAMLLMTERNVLKENTRKWTSLKASADSFGFTGVDNFNITGGGDVVINKNAADGSLVDYTLTDIQIGSLDFDIKKTDGGLLSVDGVFDINIADFLVLDQQTISLEISFKDMLLSDGESVTVQYLTFGKAGIDAFAGIGELGFGVENANVGVGLFVDMLNPKRFWVAAKGFSNEVTFGGSDLFDVSATSLDIAINTKSNVDGTTINFSQGLEVKDGIAGSSTIDGLSSDQTVVTLDMSGETISASGDLNLNLFNFVQMEGAFSFDKSTQNVDLSDGSNVKVESLVLSGEDVNAFAGFSLGDDKLGFEVTDLDFVFAMMNEKTGNRQWSALSGNIANASFVGVSGITISGSSLNLEINNASIDGLVVDYTTATLPSIENLNLDFDSNLKSYTALKGTFDIDAFGVVKAANKQAEFLVESTPVLLSDGTTANISMLTMAITDLDFFAGIPDTFGFNFENTEIGLLLGFSTSGEQFATLQASTENFEFVSALPFEMSAKKVSLGLNYGSNSRVIDYATTPLVVKTGITSSELSVEGSDEFNFTVDGSKGVSTFIDIEDALLSVSAFAHLSGDFSLNLGVTEEEVVLGSKLPSVGGVELKDSVQKATLDASNVDLFAGIGGIYLGEGDSRNTGTAVGMFANNVNVALALYKGRSGTNYFALKSSIESMGVTGFGSILTANVQNVELMINESTSTTWIDFEKSYENTSGLLIKDATGTKTTTIDFTTKYIQAQIGYAEFAVAEFLSLEGSFAFTKGEQITASVNIGDLDNIVKQVPGMDMIPGWDQATVPGVKLDTIQIGAMDINGFAGVAGMGVDLNNVDFAMSIMSTADIITPISFLAAKASVESASLVGFGDVLDLDLNDVEININTSNVIGLPPLASAALRMPFVDLSSNPLNVATGKEIDGIGQTIPLDFGEEIIQAKIGYAQGVIASALQVSGSLAFTKRGSETVTLSDGSKEEVMSLALGGTDIYGFFGASPDGSYWEDSNNDGFIDEKDTPNSGVGMAIEDLDIGVVFMRGSEVTDPSIYTGANIDLSSASLVGVGDAVTLEAKDLTFDLNQSTSDKVVDFSKSGENGSAYEILTGKVVNGVDEVIKLETSERIIKVTGEAKIEAVGMLALDGVFDFEITDDGLTAFADVTATIGTSDTIEFSSHATGLLVIADGGMAARMLLDQNIDLGPIASVDVKFDLIMNNLTSLNKDIVYTVPNGFKDKVSYSEFTIPLIPPSEDSKVGDYLYLGGNGNITFLDSLKLDGDFSILLTDSKTEMNVDASLSMPIIETLSAVGTLGFADGGIYGSIAVGTASSTLIDSGAFSIKGNFLLQINTTSKSQKVKELNIIDGSVDVNSPTKNIDLQSGFVHISGVAELDLSGAVLKGAMDLTLTKSGFDADVDLTMKLGGLGSIDVIGAASIGTEGNNPFFAMKVDVDAKLGIDVIAINAGGLLEINTGSQSHAGVAGGRLFNLELDGDMSILGFNNIALKGAITIENSLFNLKIDEAKLNFFDFVTFNMDGYIRSDGKFNIHGEVSSDIDLKVIVLKSKMELTVANPIDPSDPIFSFKASGSVSLHIDFGLFEVNKTLAGLKGEANVYAAAADLSIKLKFMGIDFSSSIAWSFGEPPVIAEKKGSTLYLNMGDRGQKYRGDLYKEIIGETYNIKENDNGDIEVSALGETKTYSGITKIVANGGEGNDMIIVDPSLGNDVTLEFDGEEGDDGFFIGNAAANSVIIGGDGDDRFGSNASVDGITFKGGDGDDVFSGSDSIEYINMGEGKNEISASGGNDKIESYGYDTIYGGSGDDIINIRATSKAYAGNGTDTILINATAVDSIVYGGSGDDKITSHTSAKIYGDGGNDNIISNVESDINAGSGNDTIKSYANDKIYAGSGNDTIYVYDGGEIYGDSGNDTFIIDSLNTSFTTSIYAGSGNDTLELGTLSSSSALKFGINKFSYNNRTINFDSKMDRVNLEDTSSSTLIQNYSASSKYSWSQTDLYFKANGSITTASDVLIDHENSFLSYESKAINSVLNTDVKDITIVTQSDITIVEKDDLNIVKSVQNKGGIYTSNGAISLTLNKKDALLALVSGIISTNNTANADISIYADDIDFNTGRDMVTGAGALIISSKSLNQSYKLGTYGNSKYDNDFSTGEIMGYMNLSAKDFNALSDNFTSVTIGHKDQDVEMYIGDLENDEYNTRLNNITTFNANEIYVKGDIQSSTILTLNSDLLQIYRTNVHAPMGVPDSGISAKEIYLNIDEQMVTSGWIIAEDKIEINILHSTGNNNFIRYSEGINSLKTDMGTSIKTLNDNSEIIINTSHSIYTASYLHTAGDNSSIVLNTNTGGITNLQGGYINVQGEGSTITFNSASNVNFNVDSAVAAGVEYDYSTGVPVAVKTGEYGDITINADGEVGLNGSVAVSGNLVLNTTSSTSDHADYFDNINGKTVASTTSNVETIISGLKSGTLSVNLKNLFDENDLTLGDNATVTSVANFVPFASLTNDQKLKIVDDLGYRVIGKEGESFYYNSALNSIETSFTQGYAIEDSSGYTKYDGQFYYDEFNKTIETSFVKVVDGDYVLDEINWGTVTKPTSGTAFEKMTQAQKDVLIEAIGYKYDEQLESYYNFNAVPDKKIVTTFSEGKAGDYRFDSISWGDVTVPLETTPFDKLTNEQKSVVASSLGFETYSDVYYNENAENKFVKGFGSADYDNELLAWGTLEAPAVGTSFDALTDDQKNAVITSLGYTQYTGEFYYKADADIDKRIVSTFTADVDYDSSSVTLNSDQQSPRYVVTDGDNTYVVYENDPDGNGVVDRIDIQTPHNLLGQRGYGFMLTGTFTSLQDNADIVISSEKDVIVRGIFNLLGSDSNLTVQSNTWTYWEGTANVTGDISIYGGVELDGTISDSALERSLYVESTSRLITENGDTSINLKAGKDAELNGAIVAGGTVGPTGVTYNGVDATVSIEAGEQIFLNAGVVASKSIDISTSKSTSADDEGYGLIVTAGGSLIAGANSSDNTGGNITIDTVGSISMIGNVYSGLNLVIDPSGPIYNWSDEYSEVSIKSGGQIYIGGVVKSVQGEDVEIGGSILANHKIELTSGIGANDVGIHLPGASSLVVNNLHGSIVLSAIGDAYIYGKVVAGGEIVTTYDALGRYLGTTTNTFGGNSTISISAEKQIVLTQDLYAGKSIDLSGGFASGNGEGVFAQYGVVVGGTVGLKTWMKNSEINISSKGDTIITAPAWTEQIVAQDFSKYASGKITSDITLNLEVNLGTHTVQGLVTLKVSETNDNNNIQDLVADLQTAIDTTSFKVVKSPSGTPAIDSFKTINEDADYPEVQVRLLNGKLMLSGNYETKLLKEGSINAGVIGFSQINAADAISFRTYAIDASQSGSVVNIGNQTGLSGEIYIAGKIRAHSAINLYSGTNDDGSQNFSLGTTGVLETLSGSVVLNPGDYGVLTGTIIARGETSDIILNSKYSMDIVGNLTAGRNIYISAGTVEEAGNTSITTYGTSELISLSDEGTIQISGLNDVVINSTIGGEDSPNLKLIDLSSQTGTLTLEKTSGRISTGASLVMSGENVDLAGVIKSTKATESLSDYEVEIKTSGDVDLHGDFDLAGSFIVDTKGSISIYNMNLLAKENQKITLKAGGNFSIGTTNPQDGIKSVNAVTISADKKLEIKSGKLLYIGSDAILQTAKEQSTIDISAQSMILGGAIEALEANSTINITSDTILSLGTKGLDEEFNLVDRGGKIISSGLVNIQTGTHDDGLGLVLSSLSVVESLNSDIIINSIGEVQQNGIVQALSENGDITINSNSLIYVSNLIKATNTINLKGGTHSQKTGIYLNEDASVTTTAVNGNISLNSTDNVYIGGVLGESSAIDNEIQANVQSIDIVSTKGDINIQGSVDAKDSINLKALNINVLYPGRVYASHSDSTVRLDAQDRIFADLGSLINADKLVHLYANDLKLSGTVQTKAADAIAYLSARKSIEIKNELTSNDIILNSGIQNTWSMDDIETQNKKVNKDNLSSGNVSILESSIIEATNNFTINAGGEVNLNASASVGDAITLVLPIVTTKTVDVEVITGYKQVDGGTIDVEVITFEESVYTEQIGTVEVVVGDQHIEMQISLIQTGYYSSYYKTFKEYFVEGHDYYNSTIQWARNGLAAPEDGATFSELTDAQKDLVLETKTYQRAYDFSYTSMNGNKNFVTLFKTDDLGPSSKDMRPAWYNDTKVWQSIDVEGLRDKMILMPAGAAEEVLKVVGAGNARYLDGDTSANGYNNGTWKSDPTGADGERVGYYHDEANVYYDYKDQSFKSTLEWNVTYKSGTGDRIFDIVGNSGDIVIDYTPDWESNKTAYEISSNDKLDLEDKAQIYAREDFIDTLATNTSSYDIIGYYNVNDWQLFVVGFSDNDNVNSYDENIWWDSLTGDPDNLSYTTKFTNKSVNGLPPPENWSDVIKDRNVWGVAMLILDGQGSDNGDHRITTGSMPSFDDLADWYHDTMGVMKINTWNDEVGDGGDQAKANIWGKYRDYEFEWTSKSSAIYDQRVSFEYTLVYQSEDVTKDKPLTETKTKKVKVVDFDTQTVWNEVAQMGTETQTYKERSELTQEAKTSSAYDSKMLSAKNIVINAQKDVNISSWIEASNDLTINSESSITVQGTVALGADLESTSILSAVNSIVLNSGESTTLASSAKVNANEISIVSNENASLAGDLNSTTTFDVEASNDVLLDGKITANSIDVKAGENLDATILANVKANTTITLLASNDNMDLSDASFEATTINLSAINGSISQSAQLKADDLTASSKAAMTLNLTVNSINASTTAKGNINLTSTKAIELTSISATNGDINITSFGEVTIKDAKTLGTTESNDLNVATYVGDILVENIALGTLGDITLNSVDAIDFTNADISADELSVFAKNSISILNKTSVNSFSATTRLAGNVEFTQDASKALTLKDIKVAKGTLDIVNDETITALDVQIQANEEASNISITSSSDIILGYISAGRFVNDKEQFDSLGLELELDDETTSTSFFTSLGDIVLSSQGNVSSLEATNSVNIVADYLSISAITGIESVVAVNKLENITSTSSDITITDINGFGEIANILKVGNISTNKANQDTVTIESSGIIDINESSLVSGDIIRLVSQNDDIVITKPTNGTNMDYSYGIGLSAVNGTISSYQFFDASGYVEYRAGEQFQFGYEGSQAYTLTNDVGTTSVVDYSQNLPNSLSADTIIIQTGSSYTLKDGQTLTAKDKLELISTNADVIVNGEISVKSGDSDGRIDNFIVQAEGDIVLQNRGISAQNHEIEAGNDIFVNYSDQDISLVGKIEAGNDINLVASGDNKRITAYGATLLADGDINLTSEKYIYTDGNSLYAADNLNAVSKGYVTLNTMVNTLTVQSLTEGNITVKEADELTITNATATLGDINITSGDNMIATWVATAGSNVSLKTYGQYLKVGYIETSSKQNQQDKTASVRLESGKYIYDDSYNDGTTDIYTKSLSLYGSTSSSSSYKLETNTGATIKRSTTITPVDIENFKPTTPSYTLKKFPNGQGDKDISIEVSKILTIEVDVDGDKDATLEGGNELIIKGDIKTTGDVVLKTKKLEINKEIIAEELSVTADEVDIKTTVSKIPLIDTSSGPGDVKIEQTGDVVITKIKVPSTSTATVDITGTGNITIDKIEGSAKEINIIAEGDVIIKEIQEGIKLNIITKGEITLGTSTTTVDIDELDIEVEGDVVIYEKDNIIIKNITQENPDSKVEIHTGGKLVLEDNILVTNDNDVIFDSGDDIVIKGSITVGSGDVVIKTDGKLEFDNDEEFDIVATNSKVTLDVEEDISDDEKADIFIDVSELNITNGNGDIHINEKDDLVLTIDDKEGNITLSAGGKVDIEEVIGEDGDITVSADDIEVNGKIKTQNADIVLDSSKDIILHNSIYTTGTGNIELTATKGKIVNETNEYTTTTSIDTNVTVLADLEVAKYSTSSITTAETTLIDSGIILSSSAGDVILKAYEQIGSNTTKEGAIIIDAKAMSAVSNNKNDVSVAALKEIKIKEIKGDDTAQTSITLQNFSGVQTISEEIDAKGGDITIITKDVDITKTIKSNGGKLVFAPTDVSASLMLGTSVNDEISADDLYVDQGEIEKIEQVASITFGAEGGSYTVKMGDTDDTSNTEILFNAPIIIINNGEDGHTVVSDTIISTSSFTGMGSGHTTAISASQTYGDDYYLSDSIQVTGDQSITVTNGDIIIDDTTDVETAINGDSATGDDKLTLIASDDITINAEIGADPYDKDSSGTTYLQTDYLEELNVSAENITFNEAVTLDGDFIINATGTVTFEKDVTITNGDLSILGATNVIFNGVVNVTSGDITVQANEIDIADTFNGDGTLTFKTTSDTLGMNVATTNNSSANLDLTATELSNISDGFTQIVFGKIDIVSTHAEDTTNNIKVYDFDFDDSVAFYANNITVNEELTTTENMIFDTYDTLLIDDSVSAAGDIAIYTSTGSVSQDSGTISSTNLDITSKAGVTMASVDTTNIDVDLTQGSIDINFESDVNIENMDNDADITLESNSNMILTEDITSTASVNIEIDGNFSMNDGVVLTTSENDGYITINTNGNMALSKLVSQNIIVLSSQAVISDNLTIGNNIETTSLDVSAGSGIDLDTAIDTLELSNTLSGKVIINEVDDINLEAITLSSNSEEFNLITTGDLNILNSLTNSAAVGGIILDAKNILVNGAIYTQNGDLDIKASGSYTQNYDVSNDNGNIIVEVENEVVQNADLLGINGDINVTSLSSNIIMADTTTTSLANSTGDVSYTANNNIALSYLTTNGEVLLEATLGMISDITASEDANIKVDNLTVVSNFGFGTASEDIDLEVENVTITNKVSGGIYIDELDDLEINSLKADDQNIYVNAGSSILDGSNDEEANIESDTLTIIANDSIGTVEDDLDLSVTTITSVKSTTSDMYLSNDKALNLENINAFDSVTLEVDGSLNLQTIEALNNLTLDVNGSIFDTKTSEEANIKTNNLTIIANDSIGTSSDELNLNITTLDYANAKTEDMYVLNEKSLNVKTIDVFNSVTLDVNGSIFDTSSNEDANITTKDLIVTTNTGFGTVSEDIDLDVETIDLVNTLSGNVYIDALNNIGIKTIKAANQTVSINAGDSILDASSTEDVNIIAQIANLNAANNIGGTNGADIDLDVQILNGSILNAGSFVVEDIDSLEIGTINAANAEVTIIVAGSGNFSDADYDHSLNITANHLRLVGHGISSEDDFILEQAIETKAKTVSLGSYVTKDGKFELIVQNVVYGKLIENKDTWTQFVNLGVFVPITTDISPYSDTAYDVGDVNLVYTDYELLRYLMQRTYYMVTKQSLASTLDGSLSFSLPMIESNDILRISSSLYDTFISLGADELISGYTENEEDEEETFINTYVSEKSLNPLASMPEFGGLTFDQSIIQENNTMVPFEYWIENIAI